MQCWVTIFLILNCLILPCYGQDVAVVEYEDVKYFLYPEKQKINHGPSPLTWEKEIQLTRRELKKYKWFERRFFKREMVATEFPIDGLWLQLFESDSFQVAKIFTIENGLPNGELKRYNEYGDLVEKGNYVNGNRNDVFYFYPDSSSYKKEFAVGKYDMPDSSYYRFAFFPYYHVQEEGKVGLWEYRDFNGKIQRIENYKNGELDGQRLSYYQNGEIKFDLNYKNGSLDGVQKRWYRGGQIKEESNYVSGLRQGAFRSWYTDGKVKCALVYVEDLIVSGSCNLYHKNGAIFGQGKLEKGVKIGNWTFWHENGEKRAQGVYQEYVTDVCISGFSRDYLHSVRLGEWIFWYPNSEFLAKGSYDNTISRISRGQIYQQVMRSDSWICKDEKGNDVSCEEIADLLDFEKE